MLGILWLARQVRQHFYPGDINVALSWHPFKCNDIVVKSLIYIQLFHNKILFNRKGIIEKLSGQLNMESYLTSLIKREKLIQQ